jgi:hypothetical protein
MEYDNYDYYQQEDDEMYALAHQSEIEARRLEEESEQLLAYVTDATRRLEYMLDNIRLFDLLRKGARDDTRNIH